MDLAEQLIDFADERRNSGLAGPELLPVRLMRACAKVLPVAAAGISMFSRGDHRVPLGASDDTAAFAERLQFTVGEGPCLNAHNQGRPILATEAVIAERWPTFYDELVTHTPYRSITSFPVRRGLNGDAAIDLYFTDPQPQVSPRCLADAWCAVDTVGEQLTRGWKPTANNLELPAWLDSEPARMRMMVWTAIGMVNVALQLTTAQALVRLRGYAYSHSSTVDALADSLTTGDLDIAALDF